MLCIGAVGGQQRGAMGARSTTQVPSADVWVAGHPPRSDKLQILRACTYFDLADILILVCFYKQLVHWVLLNKPSCSHLKNTIPPARRRLSSEEPLFLHKSTMSATASQSSSDYLGFKTKNYIGEGDPEYHIEKSSLTLLLLRIAKLSKANEPKDTLPF
jgi:hypothetical protein